jgi:hypothetical protein
MRNVRLGVKSHWSYEDIANCGTLQRKLVEGRSCWPLYNSHKERRQHYENHC